MARSTDVRVVATSLHFLPVELRVPLKFGKETLVHVTCARVRVTVENPAGARAFGWGETPLSVPWAWPSTLPYAVRHEAMQQFSVRIAEAWAGFDAQGHPIEIGYDFVEQVLPTVLAEFNKPRAANQAMPWLAALICASAFDLAIHDAYGVLHECDIYSTYAPPFLSRSLETFMTPAKGSSVAFIGLYPKDFLLPARANRLLAWHLVGGLDPLTPAEQSGQGPDDGYPVLLADWIQRDGLTCLKVKLRGTDADWDYARLVAVGQIAMAHNALWLSADFNCTVTEPAYVNAILDRLLAEHPRLFAMLLYVEQPFPYELEQNQIDVHSIAGRKPLFMDESAHDWRLVRLGRSLGWSGVALKTCKTQTGAILSACWARAHGMPLMVQDLTNPMLAMIPHALLAAHVGTIAGVETNAPQFYPDASRPEEAVHPGLYRRRGGQVDLGTLRGPGFGYQLDEISRMLPVPAAQFGG
ncbi:MAG: mandelate racemase/muconate lactonizing enzyme family protein [Phycisphaerae bacterium]|nr:mandelate racemase/muconate lactonizing enzyme family protein [Phycisphaerae bacterium]